ncbi:hypothetical protein [Serratia fonticola]|uniref:hypothetical protein n=1 Tax=Serratia fonticola TaxID=47917 RepID=UPI0021ADDD1F|nr:hypothetical protein [Serratia fonticola]
MTKNIVGLLIISMASAVLIGCAYHDKKDRLVYVSGNDSFVLKKECVSEMKLIPNQNRDKHPDAMILAMMLNKSADCSGKLNSVFNENVGSTAAVYFNDVVILEPTQISSEVKTELSFRQYIPDGKIGIEILNAYQK